MQLGNYKPIYMVLLLMSSILCSNTGCKNKQYGEQEILFYYRDIGNNNGYKTYGDYLVVTNYINKSITIRQFANIAQQYIDTIKSDLPVSAITFVGKKPGGKLPAGNWDTYMKQKKYFVVGIDFNNSLSKNANQKPEISSISISWNEKWKMYIQQSEIDSLLNVKEPVDTGF
ncbi:hypothetical protein [Limnovirga soli]|uniref:Uncharacterized protein n=1 Tax=Limnovirga soli TaxID=2656915 RepID=A0A8J8JV38_9BACT|nr:hypothetical protein [Limnovirga soli]NNV57693.1 hypothetical protein [Limnovirga soli]